MRPGRTCSRPRSFFGPRSTWEDILEQEFLLKMGGKLQLTEIEEMTIAQRQWWMARLDKYADEVAHMTKGK